MAWSSEDLKNEYVEKAPLYHSLCRELTMQLEELFKQAGVSLAFPIQARVKTWDSIAEKCERNALEPSSLSELGDLAGLRVIVLFSRDSELAREIIRENFNVLREEDTADRLAEDQFGYGSIHFEVTLKDEWLKIPTLAGMGGLTAEFQLRTASQHIWAASSHFLQYKKESHVPGPVRRSINRAAALLETVDLEFERVLAEREEYAAANISPQADARLDTDLVRTVLDTFLPPENRGGDDSYADLLDDLIYFKVDTVADLEALLKRHENVMRMMEEKAVEEAKGDDDYYEVDEERLKRGVYFTHVGLSRSALEAEFSSKFRDYLRKKSA